MSIENLMQNVFDYFLSLYHQSSGTPVGNSILAFQPIGTHITPNMFKLKPTDTAFSANLAVEQFSSLTNVVPQISADTFQRTFKTVEQSYDFLLEGSFPSPNGDVADLTVFSNFKAQAKKSFDEMQVGSMLKPLTKFHLAYATPIDWYDTSSDANWTAYSSESSTSESQTHAMKADWRWQVLSAELAPILLHPEVVDRISTVDAVDLKDSLKDVLVHPDTSQIDTSNVVLKPELEARLGSVLKIDLSSSMGRVLTAELPVSRLSVAPMSAASMSVAPMAEAVSLMDVGRGINISSRVIMVRPTDPIHRLPVDLVPIDGVPIEQPPQTEKLSPISSPVVQTARLRELVKQSTEQTVVSKDLKLSFKYCLVQVDRPWISQTYLETKQWYLPSHKSGSFSTGAFSDNDEAVFPVIPNSLILIKDLQITSWDEVETDVIERSLGFGPFSFIGRTVDRNTKILTSAGVQVIGWVSQVMPLLPPDSDPTP